MAVESHPLASMPQHTSVIPIRSAPSTPTMDSRHTPDATTARARRSLATSRAARSGINNMVESLRVSKPPRAPCKLTTQPSAATVARRHALIPMAEGRDKLEARIRSLEDSLAARDEASVRLKRQLGRALIKRRHLERERDSVILRLSTATTAAHSYHTLAVTTHNDFQALVNDIATTIRSTIISNTDSITETNNILQAAAEILLELRAPKEDSNCCLHLIIESVKTAVDKLKTPLPPCTVDASIPSPVASTLARLRPSTVAAQCTVSTAPSDDDAKSCGSFTSSALGDDRDAQLESLIELIDILDAKLSSGGAHTAASNALARARRTVSHIRSKQTSELRESDASGNSANSHDRADEQLANGERRDAIVHVVNDILSGRSQPSADGAALTLNEALALAASTKVELEEARQELDDMQQRVFSMEKSAERGLRYDEAMEQNTMLQSQLATAKKTITRMIQDARGPRRFSHSTTGGPQSAGSTPEVVRKADRDPESVQRILKWRQSASSEAAVSNAHVGASSMPKIESEGKRDFEHDEDREDQESDFDEAEQAPVNVPGIKRNEASSSCRKGHGVAKQKSRRDDRGVAPSPSQTSLGEGRVETKAAQRTSMDGGVRNGTEGDVSRSESANESAVESFDLGSNEAGSSASAPVRGFLRLGTGSAMSLSGDEISLMGRHNIFGPRTRQTDGLRGLLG